MKRQPPQLPNQYVGHFNQVTAQVRLESSILPVILSGEIVAQGRRDGDRFVPESWQRLALAGRSPVDELREGRYAPSPLGVISLVGPVFQPEDDDTLATMPVQLHYEALSLVGKKYRAQLPTDQNKADAVFPEIEKIAAQLNFTIDEAAPLAVRLSLELKPDQQSANQPGRIESVAFDPILLTLQPYNSETYQPRQHQSLTPNCPSPNGLGGSPTVLRRLPLKFINLCQAVPTVLAVEQVCQTQLDGVCEVWRNKAALEIDADAGLLDGTLLEKEEFCALSDDQEYGLRLLSYHSATHVEVYLIDEFASGDDHGGGIAYDAGTSGAFCILQYNLAQENPYLLAHELGHVLGLDHPLGQQPDLLPGSPASIMEVGHPNPRRNTRDNCRVFDDRPGQLPHNPIVITTAVADFFSPDP